ncbi:MAG TPA: FecR domain-containing protein [Candidatus Synoicihabitans sp.]|nr:FecR domain-containing protein [Candidatus Synoicihabitans sp.]
MESVKEVEEQAAAWLIKRDSGRWTEADQQALDQWLEASTAHTVAFIRLESAWQRTGQLKALGAGTPRGVVPSPDDWQLSAVFRTSEQAPGPPSPVRFGSMRHAGWAIAASVMLAIIVGAWYVRASEPSYRTPLGGVASVPMVDGSTITLNTDSEVRVALDEHQRRVRLDQGEAFFQVAKDASRPFIVGVDGTRVIAVGTAFSVRRERDEVLVFVTEGEVKIESDGRSPVHVPAGNLARRGRDQTTLEAKAASELDAALSWRTGFLVFRETPLSVAAAEFNRYNARKIVVADEGVGSIRLSGKFRSTQHDAFIRLVEAGFPVHVQQTTDTVILTRR